MRTLLEGTDESIVINDEFRDTWSRLVALQGDTHLPAFHLDEVDWANLTTKADLQRLFEGR